MYENVMTFFVQLIPRNKKIKSLYNSCFKKELQSETARTDFKNMKQAYEFNDGLLLNSLSLGNSIKLGVHFVAVYT